MGYSELDGGRGVLQRRSDLNQKFKFRFAELPGAFRVHNDSASQTPTLNTRARAEARGSRPLWVAPCAHPHLTHQKTTFLLVAPESPSTSIQ